MGILKLPKPKIKASSLGGLDSSAEELLVLSAWKNELNLWEVGKLPRGGRVPEWAEAGREVLRPNPGDSLGCDWRGQVDLGYFTKLGTLVGQEATFPCV